MPEFSGQQIDGNTDRAQFDVPGYGSVELRGRLTWLLAEEMHVVTGGEKLIIFDQSEGETKKDQSVVNQTELELAEQGIVPVYTDFSSAFAQVLRPGRVRQMLFDLDDTSFGVGGAPGIDSEIGRARGVPRHVTEQYRDLSRFEIIRALYMAHYRFKNDEMPHLAEVSKGKSDMRKFGACAIGSLAVFPFIPLIGALGFGYFSIAVWEGYGQARLTLESMATDYANQHLGSLESSVHRRSESAVWFMPEPKRDMSRVWPAPIASTR